MPIIVKPIKVQNRIALEIMSGYRSGQLVGSEDGRFAQFFSTEEAAIKWAEETGYTVVIDIPASVLDDGDIIGIPVPSEAYQKLLDTKVNLPEGTQIIVFGDGESNITEPKIFDEVDTTPHQESIQYQKLLDTKVNLPEGTVIVACGSTPKSDTNIYDTFTKEEREKQQIEKHSQNYPKGMTVKELKALISNWPETDENGDDTEVFISTEEGIDYSVHSSWCTDVRTNDKGELVYSITLDVEKR